MSNSTKWTFRMLFTSICFWLVYNMLLSALTTHHSATSGRGGFPLTAKQEFYIFLTNKGFALISTTVATNIGQTYERFRGSFRGSRPFFVTLSAGRVASRGFDIETEYYFDGFTWSVEDSAKKAEEFSKLVNEWEEDHPFSGQNVSRLNPQSSH